MTEFAAADGYTTINCFLFASYDNLIAFTLFHISYYSVYCSTLTTPIILFLFGICWIESSGLVVCSASAGLVCFFLSIGWIRSSQYYNPAEQQKIAKKTIQRMCDVRWMRREEYDLYIFYFLYRV